MTHVETQLWRAIAKRQEGEMIETATQASFETLYERMSKPLAAYIYRVSGDAQCVEDLTQETFYRYLRAPSSDGDENQRRALLYRIATNLIYDRWRKSKHHREWQSTAQLETSVEPQYELAPDMQRLMNQLEPRERALLWHAYVEGASHGEIAEILQVSTISVKVMLFRAKRKMAAVLRKNGFGQ